MKVGLSSLNQPRGWSLTIPEGTAISTAATSIRITRLMSRRLGEQPQWLGYAIHGNRVHNDVSEDTEYIAHVTRMMLFGL